MRPQIPEGASVKVSHLRTIEPYLPGLWARHTFEKYNENVPGLQVHPGAKGGKTVVEITLPDGRNATGVAECSANDNYSKRIGRDIAVGRALKELAS